MTAGKFSQHCGINSHYTCSNTDCNHSQPNFALGSVSNRARFRYVAAIVCTFFCAVLLAACSTSSVLGSGVSEGVQREEGKFPNVPLVMDQLPYWNEEKFGEMLLLTDEYGGGPSSAFDLGSAVESEGCEMYEIKNYGNQSGNLVLDIFFATPIHEGTTVQRGSKTLESIIIDLPHAHFEREDAFALLQKCGIAKSSIKIYDDIYSKGLNVGQLANQESSARWGAMYEMAGETTTESGDPLYFSLIACSSIAMGSEEVVAPSDSVELKFSTVCPFTLDPVFGKQSDSPISDEEAYEYLADY